MRYLLGSATVPLPGDLASGPSWWPQALLYAENTRILLEYYIFSRL